MQCEPAHSIINKFGGPKAVADITGVTPHSVMMWRYPRSKKGTGGAVPHWHQLKLLVAARKLGIELSPSTFFPGDMSS